MREWYQRKTVEERRAWVARRDQKLQRERDTERAKQPERRAYITANTKRWRKEHPERMAAQNAVARALRRGELEKGQCERECQECSTVIHAHHDDYSKPLEVRWLCALHHAAVHRELRQANAVS